ncbi:MAG: GDYXXLXY domain-containing protein [Gammaproteobacteria bacterium]
MLFKNHLAKELVGWIKDGLVNQQQAEAICEHYEVSMKKTDHQAGAHNILTTIGYLLKEGVFLRGRATNARRGLSVNYGLEAFFAPKEKALQLEKDLRSGAIAVLMVDGSGHARIKEILPK